MPLDVDALRAATPGVEHVVHLDHAGASLMSRATTDAVVDHLERESAVGGARAAAEAAERLDATRAAFAALVGGASDEVAFVDNASRAWAVLVSAFDWRPGDRVVTGRSEYGSNAAGLHQLSRRHGVEVVVVDDDADGTIDLDSLSEALEGPVRLVTLTHVPGTNGLVEPAEAVGSLVAGTSARFVLDASQSLGQISLDVDAIGCDALVGTSRKYLRGPRGVGVLWLRSDTTADLVPGLPELAAAEELTDRAFVPITSARRFEAWEGHVAGRVGFGVALAEALALGIDAVEARIGTLAASLRGRLAGIPGVEVHERGVRRSGIVTFSVAGRRAGDVVADLQASGINVAVARASSTPFDPMGRDWSVVRASVHAFNTDEELDRLVQAVPGPR